MKICFYGVGGVGGYFGALVTDRFKDQHEIYFIARGSHKDAICSNGLTLKKSGGEATINVKPLLCTDSVNDLPVCDIIILSVKSYDLDNASKDIETISNNNTIILPLLNGVDIYDRIRSVTNVGVVLPSCVFVGTHIESPGVVFQKGGNCKILFGCDPLKPHEDLEKLRLILQESGIAFNHEAHINTAIWSKFIFIAAYGLVTATFNKTVGEVFASNELKQKTKSIMEEVAAIAAKLNVILPPNIVENSLLKANDFPFETKTSFQRDVESKGKINESDLFGGTITRYGTKLGVHTPVTNSVFEMFLTSYK